jgi:hypothetical protein
MNCRLNQGLFDRWYIFHPTDDRRAWSGSRWVPVSEQGLPAGGVQVCNFESEQAAAEYAKKSLWLDFVETDPNIPRRKDA